MGTIGTALTDFWRFAVFQPIKGDPATHWRTYLIVGVLITWIVGFGRYWDDASAKLLLRSGVTSIAYALVLSAFIWLLVLGLKPQRWSYRNVLLMVTMTALPGIIYAIPVEMLMEPSAAGAANMTFLGIVAVWRMAIYFVFLKRVANLPPFALLVGWLLPPSIIVAVLGLYGMMYVIAAGMGGVRTDLDPDFASMQAVALVGMAAWIALPVLALAYIVLAVIRNRPQGSDASPDSRSA
jgi:hypothetical protein